MKKKKHVYHEQITVSDHKRSSIQPYQDGQFLSRTCTHYTEYDCFSRRENHHGSFWIES